MQNSLGNLSFLTDKIGESNQEFSLALLHIFYLVKKRDRLLDSKLTEFRKTTMGVFDKTFLG